MIRIENKSAVVKRITKSVICVGLLQLASGAQADLWYVEPHAKLRVFYDDNVQLSIQRPKRSSGVLATAGVESGRRTENSEIGLIAAVRSTQYANASELDETDVALGLTSAYQMGRSRFGLDGEINYDSTLTSEVLTSGLVQTNKRRQRIRLTPSWAYMLSPLMQVKTSLNYQKISYEDVDFIPLFDYSFATAQMTLIYALSERTQVFSRASYYRYDAEQIDTQSLNYSMELGAGHLLTERLSMSAFAGLRSTEAESPALAGIIEKNNNVGPIFRVELTQTYERGRIRMSADRSLVPSGSGTLLDTTSLGVSADYRFNERWNFIIRANGYRNRMPDGESSNYNRDYALLSPAIRHHLTQSLSLDLGYRYRWQEYENSTSDASSNELYLSLQYTMQRESLGKWSVLSN